MSEYNGNSEARRRVYDALVAHNCRPGPGAPDRQYMALCPAHDDHTPSLSVGYGYRDGVGRVLLTCLAGCTAGEDVTPVCGALGIAQADLFDGDRSDFRDRDARDFANLRAFPSTATLRGKNASPLRSTVDVDVVGSTPLGEGLDAVFEQYRLGEIEPIEVPLPLGNIPQRYVALRALGEFVALAVGLSLASFEFGDVPLSTRYVAKRMGWVAKGKPDVGTAWRGLNALERYGVIEFGEPREDIKKSGRACRTVRPPEPLATELGYARRKLRLVRAGEAA